MIIIHVFKYTDTGILYKILNFEEGLSRKDKLYNRLTEEFRCKSLKCPPPQIDRFLVATNSNQEVRVPLVLLRNKGY